MWVPGSDCAGRPCPSSVWALSGLRLGSVWAPSWLRLGTVLAPSWLRPGSAGRAEPDWAGARTEPKPWILVAAGGSILVPLLVSFVA